MPSLKQIIKRATTKSRVKASRTAIPASRPVVYLGNETLLTETSFNRKIYLDSNDVSLTPHIVWGGGWEPWVTDFFVRELKEGANFVDVGANCGYFALLAAHLVGKNGSVIAIEPQQKLSKLIQKSIYVNGFNNYARSYQLALGAESGVAQIAKNDFLSGSASIAGLGEFTDSYEEVKVEPLSEVLDLASASLGKGILPDLIKIDVEGYEELAWRGARNVFSKCKNLTICLEFSPTRYIELGSNSRNFMSMIREDGFDVFLLDHQSQERRLEGALETEVLDMLGQSDLVLRKQAV